MCSIIPRFETIIESRIKKAQQKQSSIGLNVQGFNWDISPLDLYGVGSLLNILRYSSLLLILIYLFIF